MGTKARTGAGRKEGVTLESVEQVMRQSKAAMSAREIVDLAGGSLPCRSKTPETVVARDLSVNIAKLGEESRFVRTAPGRYTLREFIVNGLVDTTMPIRGPAPKDRRDEAQDDFSK